MTGDFASHSAEETEALGAAFAADLESRGITRALIALGGEMGVGKTAFVRGFAAHFGIRGVKSPTYTIVNEHTAGRVTVCHFDMYRVACEDDLWSIGFEDYLKREAYLLIEWSENVADLLPKNRFSVTISRTDDGDGRRILIEENA